MGAFINCWMEENKKILLVSSAFYPEISPRSFRATELAKEFCRQHHKVTVISNFRNHNYTNFFKEYPLTLKMWDKSRVPKVPEIKQGPFSFLFRGLSRILSLLFEYPGITEMFQVKKMLKNESGFDLMISFAVPYPVHWGVAWSRTMKKRIAKFWIADCGDPYMGDILDTFKKPFYFKYLEKSFCRKAEFITIPIESAKPGYYSEFHQKIRIIPQGFDFDLEKKEIDHPVNEVPSFAYAGGFFPGARDPRPLLDYLSNIDFSYRFFIFTNTPGLIEPYKVSLNKKIIISDYITRKDLMEILAKMDFLINFDNNTTMNSPSKLIDYAILNRPVLNITKDFNGEELLAFLKRDYRNRMILPDPEKYHIKNISKKILDLLK